MKFKVLFLGSLMAVFGVSAMNKNQKNVDVSKLILRGTDEAGHEIFREMKLTENHFFASKSDPDSLSIVLSKKDIENIPYRSLYGKEITGFYSEAQERFWKRHPWLCAVGVGAIGALGGAATTVLGVIYGGK